MLALNAPFLDRRLQLRATLIRVVTGTHNAAIRVRAWVDSRRW